MNTLKVLDYTDLWNGLYYKEVTDKDKIILHHTAGYDLYSAEQWLRISSSKAWRENKYYIGVHYFIGRDGTILKCIPEENWAWNTGTGISKLDKSCIAIEIDNLGYAKREGKYLIDLYNNKFLIEEETDDYVKATFRKYSFTFRKLSTIWRGYSFFEEYSFRSIESLFFLLDSIFSNNPNIQKKIHSFQKFFPEDVSFIDRQKFLFFSGIITHCQLLGKNQKWDLSPVFPYTELVNSFNLEVIK